MELQTQHSNPSSPSIYLSASNSPNGFFRSRSLGCYYSVSSSPRRTDGKQQKCDFPNSIFDDFEFEISKKFNYSHIVDVGDGPRRRVRGDSLPAMAFADELFVSGLVMPLKLPPRLQNDCDHSFSEKSPPKSPRTVLKNPFARKKAGNDDFDPFMVALEKVREERRNSYHRRSMSQSLPFKVTSEIYSNNYVFNPQENDRGSSHVNSEVLKHSFSGSLKSKGSVYARWARDQMKEGGLSPAESPRGFLFGHRVTPAKGDQDCIEEKVPRVKEESKVQKIKGILLKYASLGRKNGGKISSGDRKASYFNGSASRKKKSMVAGEKMAADKYKAKPSFGLCLGYGVTSSVKKVK